MASKILRKETKKLLSAMELQTSSVIGADVEFARCECCGLTEECTPGYIARIRERHQGRWICGLCAEAVKYEVLRSERGINTDEAMKRHTKVCEEFKSSSPPNNSGEDLIISAVKQILRRTLDSPRRRDEGFGLRPLGRSKSCFATIPESQN